MNVCQRIPLRLVNGGGSSKCQLVVEVAGYMTYDYTSMSEVLTGWKNYIFDSPVPLKNSYNKESSKRKHIMMRVSRDINMENKTIFWIEYNTEK